MLGTLQLRENLLGIADSEALKKDIESRVTTGSEPRIEGDVPLSPSSQRVLAWAAEEAERLSHRFIGTDHVELALLREPGPAKEVLEAQGLDLSRLRQEMAMLKMVDGVPVVERLQVDVVQARVTNDDLIAIKERLNSLEADMRQMSAKLDRLLEKLGA